MVTNIVKIALRTIKRHKGYSLVNIFGLAVGLACCFLILLYVLDELRFDHSHEFKDRIGRVVATQTRDGAGVDIALTAAPLAQSLQQDIPEIVEAACFNHSGGGPVRYGGTFFRPASFEFADPAFFKIFSFEFIKGDPESALEDPHSIVLTQEMAERYFGNKEPLGEILEVGGRVNLKVTGVIKKPLNSHIELNQVVPTRLNKEFGVDIETWNRNNYTTYVLLAENTRFEEVSQKISSYMTKVYGDQNRTELRIQPLSRIYLYSDYAYDVHAKTSDIRLVYMLSLIAGFILIIACANFMNLATARSEKRMREVGLRKVVGATRGQLVRQFLGESVCMAFLALVLASLLVKLALPSFNSLSQKYLTFFSSFEPSTVLLLLAMTLLTGLLAGSYPAFFLSSFQPVQTVRGVLKKGNRGGAVRKVLVIGQFAISIILVIATVVVYKQIRYMQNRHLGYEKEHLVALNLNPQFAAVYPAFKEALLQNTDILNVTATMNLPNWEWPGVVLSSWESRSSEKEISVKHCSVDYDFFETFGIEFAAGRPFKREFPSDAQSALIVNEEAVRQMGMQDPIGKKLDTWGHKGQIIGVVEDFHFDTLRNKIAPLIIKLDSSETQYLVVRLKPDNAAGSIQTLRKTWNKFIKDYPFEFRFLDDVLNLNYRREIMLGRVTTSFAWLAVFVACLGLFGLAMFLAEQRTREIGVRKVLGASAANIVLMLSKDFTAWILVANVIAFPAALFTADLLLKDYAYRTSAGILVYLLPMVGSLLIAWITISYQSFRAALADPVRSLRYE